MLSTLLTLATTILQALPNLIHLVEQIFSDKPKSGSSKLNTVQNIIQNIVPIAIAADPKYATAIQDLTKTVNDALVAFYNAIGEFKHSTP